MVFSVFRCDFQLLGKLKTAKNRNAGASKSIFSTIYLYLIEFIFVYLDSA